MALFKELVPASFDRFNLAFISLFRIAAGETWFEGLPLVDEAGELHWKAAIYVCSCLIIHVWVLQAAFPPSLSALLLPPSIPHLRSPFWMEVRLFIYGSEGRLTE